jgi:hypothetical protein
MQALTTPAGHWFDGRSLAMLTDPGTWERGLALYVSQHVLELDIVHSGAAWILLGDVQGSKREVYEVSIELELTPEGQVASWDSLCECPVGTQCKHGVALTLKAAQQGQRLLAAMPAMPQAAPQRTAEQVEAERLAVLEREAQAARLAAQSHLRNWLQALERVSAIGPHPRPQGAAVASSGTAADRAETYLYLLSLVASGDGKPQLSLEAAVCYRKVNGDWAKPKLVRYAPFPGQDVYDKASHMDHEVLQLIAAMPKSHQRHYSYSTGICCQPMGRAGQLVLEQAASTGRLFVKNDQDRPGAAVRWGVERKLEWLWRETSSARSAQSGWNLSGKVADSPARVCHNDPLLYLDAENGECGLLLAHGIAPARLAVLLSAPSLSADVIQEHQLALLQALGPVPPPPVLQALRTLKGIVPQPCLHLVPVAPAPSHQPRCPA